jgi:hypothetical protein
VDGGKLAVEPLVFVAAVRESVQGLARPRLQDVGADLREVELAQFAAFQVVVLCDL